MTDVFQSIDSGQGASHDLRHASLYINRELSWLEFNRRVLREAQDPRTPLMERLKFLGIFSNNLDEFFQVRVSALKQQQAVGFVDRTADGLTPDQQLRTVGMAVRGLQGEHCRTLRAEVLPALAGEGVRVCLDEVDLSPEDRDHLSRYFADQVYPVLTPLAVDPAHPFPYISNLTVSLAVVLRGDDGEERFARVKVPAILPRWVPLPGVHRHIPLEAVVAMHLETLFPGQEVLGCHPFRITRNTDLDLHDDEAADLLELIAEEVRNRRFGEVVRIEVYPTMPVSLRDLLLEEFNTEQESEGTILTRDDVYEITGLINGAGLVELLAPDRPTLHDTPFVASIPPRFATGRDMFDVIAEGDVLVHHPYESFPGTVERFVNTATEDPDVLAIKITLYRIGDESGIARRLVEAAERGKQVAVLIELQARFDEESNIRWATRLQDAGAHVSYGVAGLKTHAKTILVVRREGDGIRRYVHIGTGNYSARNARTYTDFGLFSAREELGADLTDLFNVLTGFATRDQYRRLVVAPAGIRPWLLDRIRRETAHAAAGRPARIVAKINALVDQEIILALYEASNAGVQIDLVVRGICCLRPGIAGASERIRVVSLIGRFLEHSRAWWFLNNHEDEVHISSADWMPRNLDRRIEVAVPLEEPVHRALVRRLMEVCLEDNRQAWDLLPTGNYRQRHPGQQAERPTQTWLLERYQARTGDRLVLEP